MGEVAEVLIKCAETTTYCPASRGLLIISKGGFHLKSIILKAMVLRLITLDGVQYLACLN